MALFIEYIAEIYCLNLSGLLLNIYLMKLIKKHFSALGLGFLVLLATILSFTRISGTTGKALVTQKCLIVSDIHFNPFYGTSVGDSVLKKKLENASFAEWKQYFESLRSH